MMEKWLLGTGAGEGGGLAEGGVGEFGDALGEPDPGAETEVAGGAVRGGHDVPDVAEPELAGHDRLDVAEAGRQRTGHLADRMGRAPGDGVAGEAAGPHLPPPG